MRSIPFFLVTGFLGSGKTSLLKNFLNIHADHKKIAVVQNEFAESNVDGIELRSTGKKFEIPEINRGSVFCVCLLSDFKNSMKVLIDEHEPDAVILEATGLADPIAIGQLLQAPELLDRVYLSHIWCVIDATNFMVMEQTVTRIAHQVRIADTIVVNKIDLIGETNLEAAETRIKELNPHGNIIHSSFCNLPFSDTFSINTQLPVAVQFLDVDAEACSEGPPVIVSTVVRSSAKMDRSRLESFLQAFETKTYRLKGFVNLSSGDTVSVQSCFGSTSIVAVEEFHGPTELIAMGPEIDPREFRQSFDQMVGA